MKNIFKYLFFIVLVLSVSNDIYSSNVFDKKPKEKEEITLDSRTEALFFEGLKNKIIGNTTIAIAQFEKILKKYPKHGATNYLMAQIENENKDWEKAEDFITSALKRDPQNKWYKLLKGEILRNQGKLKKAIDVYEEIAHEFLGKPELYSELAMLYMYLDKPEKAIEHLNNIEKEVGVTEQLIIEKQKLYKQMGDLDKEEQEMLKLVKSDPTNPKFLNMLANMYVDNKKYDKAINIYQSIERDFPTDEYLYFNMADLYRKIDKADSAFYALKKGFANPSISLSTKVQIFMNFYSVSEMYSDQKAQAISLSKILVETHPNESKSHAIYGDFLRKDNQLEDAKEQFNQAIKLEGTDFYLWQNYLNVLLNLGEYENIRNEVITAQELFPMQPLFYLFGGIANLQLKEYEDAKNMLLQGEKLSLSGDELAQQFYLYLGEVYNDLKDFEASDIYFEKAIEEEPEDAYTLNNYAYYLSLREEKLDKAEAYAKKAVRLDAENANNQDTYGWVLFKLNRYEEAKYWIEKSIENSENPSGVVLEHLGDVYLKLDDNDKALENYKKAQSKGGYSSELLDKINKLEQ